MTKEGVGGAPRPRPSFPRRRGSRLVGRAALSTTSRFWSPASAGMTRGCESGAETAAHTSSLPEDLPSSPFSPKRPLRSDCGA
ncbi:hypothetical protein D9601_04235 [Sphingomonas sp. MA1305]|nr:hypothetical protein [Sphingomonas sp. MA1305]